MLKILQELTKVNGQWKKLKFTWIMVSPPTCERVRGQESEGRKQEDGLMTSRGLHLSCP